VTGERRLAVVAYTDADEVFGGAEQSLGNLLEALDPEIEVTVMGVRRELVDSLAARRRGGAAACVVPRPRHKRNLGPILAHVHTVARHRPTIFHANLANPIACRYGILSAQLVPGVRAIAVEQSPIAIADGLHLRTKRWLSRRLSAHVAVGEQAARATEANVGLAPGSVRTIYNGVPEVEVDPLPRATRGPIVGAVGRCSREKGFDVLVRALPLLPGVTAVLVGDGWQRSALKRSAEQLGVADRLVITGWTDDARRHLPSFDVLALPSRFEGFPLVVPEAMLAGLAVVASRVGSVPEAVRDGETGVLVAPEDPEALASGLRRLLADESARRRLGERGRTLARERFTAPVMARAFEALYEEVAR
jgi:glycosyltransferase involved in cell wall biosynthesis